MNKGVQPLRTWIASAWILAVLLLIPMTQVVTRAAIASDRQSNLERLRAKVIDAKGASTLIQQELESNESAVDRKSQQLEALERKLTMARDRREKLARRADRLHWRIVFRNIDSSSGSNDGYYNGFEYSYGDPGDYYTPDPCINFGVCEGEGYEEYPAEYDPGYGYP